jgi:ABC-2 type transport system ATP-binding protein
MVTVTDLHKSFGSTVAVDGISFSVNPGEVVGLLGPNGAGKTTTMRMITGFMSPDSGTVTVDGITVTDHPTDAQAVMGYLPENNPLYRDMLVSELLDHSCALRGIVGGAKTEAVDYAVAAGGIADVYHRSVGELSKGYRQRVGIATALIHRPKILILDEPTEGLDPNQRNEIRKVVRELGRRHTVIVSTHVMQEAEAVCTRMIIVNHGRVVADGTAAQVARMAGSRRTLVVEVEGDRVDQLLKTLSGVKVTGIKKGAGRRMTATLLPEPGREVQPELSRLAASEGWTIWRLEEEKRDLEEIFRTLTGGESV